MSKKKDAIYAKLIDELTGKLHSIFGKAKSTENDLDMVLKLCASKPAARLMDAKSLNSDQIRQRKDLLSDIVRWLLSFEEVDDTKMELYCQTGEKISTVSGQKDAWEIFQKLHILFELENDRFEAAKNRFEEVYVRLSDDSLLQEIRDKLDAGKPSPTRMGGGGLNAITDFSQYMDFLKLHLEQYAVFIASQDTPYGPGLTQEYANKIRSLGLREDIYGKFRCCYIAVIVQGKVIAEKLSPQMIECSGTVGDLQIHLKSQTWQAYQIPSEIVINGIDYCVKKRGLNFAVYDMENNIMVDRVAFDSFAESMASTKPDYMKNSLREWQQEHPGVGIVCYQIPKFPVTNRSRWEAFAAEKVHWRTDCIDLFGNPEFYPRRFFERQADIVEAVTPPKSYHDANDVRRFEDQCGRCVNTVAGHRVTTDQPEEGERTIYFVGGCDVFGYGVPDQGTIASWLQRLCNERAEKEHFVVQNYGYYLAEEDRQTMEEINILRALPAQAGDIILCSWGMQDGIPHIDLSREGERPHDHGEIFFDHSHLNVDGYRFVAERIFEKLQQENFFKSLNSNISSTVTNAALSLAEETEIPALKNFQDNLKRIYQDCFSVGAIVMNCNPFTLGHRYLIEQAAGRCGHLVVFVVEEDRSVFPFKDRLRLVKEGTEDLRNVNVLPSGQFILSSKTFSEYFNKSKLQDRIVDPSMDVELFGRDIAPCLHITKRFVGTEPFDTVTRQYNSEMKKLLPKYGVEVVEIERTGLANEKTPISASEVRRCILTGKLDTVRVMVPETTYAYIEKNLEKLKRDLEATS